MKKIDVGQVHLITVLNGDLFTCSACSGLYEMVYEVDGVRYCGDCFDAKYGDFNGDTMTKDRKTLNVRKNDAFMLAGIGCSGVLAMIVLMTAIPAIMVHYWSNHDKMMALGGAFTILTILAFVFSVLAIAGISMYTDYNERR